MSLSRRNQALVENARAIGTVDRTVKMADNFLKIQSGHHTIPVQGVAKVGYGVRSILFEPFTPETMIEHCSAELRDRIPDLGIAVTMVFGYMTAFAHVPEPGTKDYVVARPMVKTSMVYIMSWSYQDIMGYMANSFDVTRAPKAAVVAFANLAAALSVPRGSCDEAERLTHLTQINTAYEAFQAAFGVVPCQSVVLGDYERLVAIADATGIIELQACACLLIYAVGKPTKKGKAKAVTVARPKNLNDKFNNEEAFLFIGVQSAKVPGMATNFLGGSGEVWSTDATVRQALVDAVIDISYMAGASSEDMLSTTVGMLAFSNMATIYVCKKMLDAFPWVANMAEISSEIRAFDGAVEILARLPAKIRAYIKLREGDKARDIDAKGMVRLMGLAQHVLSNYKGDKNIGAFEVKGDKLLNDTFDSLYSSIYAVEGAEEEEEEDEA